MRFTDEALEIGPHAATEVDAEPALRIDASLSRVRSAPSKLFGSPGLLLGREAGVSSAIALSWAYLEGEALEEEEQLMALQENQNTFLLNFIGSSVRSQIASKAGSSWS